MSSFTQALHVLVATDLSRASARAQDRVALFGLPETRVTLLHVASESRWALLKQLPSRQGQQVEDQDAVLRAQLQRMAAKIQARRGGAVAHAMSSGKASVEISRFAKNNNIDLVVLGARGETYLRDRLLGGTALKVVQQAHSMVLVVKRRAKTAYQRIVIFTELSDKSLQMCRRVVTLFPHAAIELLHLCQAPTTTLRRLARSRLLGMQTYSAQQEEQARKHLQDMIETCRGGADPDMRARVVMSDAQPARAYKSLAAHADLIVVGRSSSTAAQERFLGSMTHDALLYGHRDVLVVP